MLAIVLNLLIQDATRSTAAAQVEVANCAPRDFVLRYLLDKKGQERTDSRLSDGILLELLVNRAARTWTIIATTPQGLSCLIAAGDQWVAPNPSGRSSE